MSGSRRPADTFTALRLRYEKLVAATLDEDEGSAARQPGTWQPLAEAVLDSCASGSPSSLAGASLDLLLTAVGIEDEQAELLRSVNKQTALLREGPFKNGRQLLTEAARVRSDPELYPLFLADARQEFYRARALVLDSAEQGVVEFNLATVWLLLQREEDASHWFATAHATLQQAVEELIDAANDVRVLKSRTGVAAATYVFFVGGAVMLRKAVKVRHAERSLRAVRQLLPLLHASQQGAVATGTRGLSTYQLAGRSGEWRLQSVDPGQLG